MVLPCRGNRPNLAAITAISFLAAASFSAPAFAGYADFVIDATSGKILAEHNADVLNHPASLTKMMTLYLTFEALHDGRLSWDQNIVMSKNGAATIPTKLGVPAGKSFTVREAVYGMIVKSANDAAEGIGDHLAGSEQNFADMMTKKARQLGMSRTVFRNGSGLPDMKQITTARDMATLAIALMRDFPSEYRLFSMRSFDFRGATIRGHNRLMNRYQGMDGLKTGFTNASGFNIVSTINRDGKRIVGVVLGGRTARSRDDKMAALLDATKSIAPTHSNIEVAAQAASPSREPTTLGYVPLPVNRPEAAFDAMAVGSIAPVRLTAGAGGSRLGGWAVQIAATDNRDNALSLLEKAQGALIEPPLGLKRSAESVTANNRTFYRARFVGFETRSSAVKTCQTLKAKEYSCIVLANMDDLKG
ncbi:peptidase M15 [Agrobacterium vitis]|uniref:Peptidase M15 n=1 Tax=Agrobacterium vitis TaxID=373 RepID=A0A6L6VMK4_AGRVI|nr:D-alanyl-D-alanine carboxypeptidase [Agrobacterium vitis]MUZ75549.1 peptidase M15 [Agrobacterium vitis]